MAMVRRPRLLLLLPLSLVVLAAGCGGSDAVPQEFVNKADAICTTQRQEIAKVPEPTELTGPALTAFLEQVLPIARQANADMHDLEPPKGHEKAWARVLGAGDRRIAQLERMLLSARANATTAYQLASQRLTAADNAFIDAAHDVGLVECAAPGSTS
jgi:hypothetical protein